MNAVAAEPAEVEQCTRTPATIVRIAAPEPDEFRRTWYASRTPVVLTGVSAPWLSRHAYTPARFRAEYGTMRVLPVAGRAPTIGEVLDMIEANDPANRPPYPARIDLDRMAPALRAEFVPRYAGSLPDRLTSRLLPTRLFAGYSNYEMFFGGPDARFPYLHYDYFHVHTWVSQLYGRKTFVLYAPSDAACLYPREDEPWQSSIADIDAPDLTRHPRFALARPHRVTLEPGDTLFLPAGWWHTTRAAEMNISVAWGQLGADNWDEFTTDVCSIARSKGVWAERLAARYLAAVGAFHDRRERHR